MIHWPSSAGAAELGGVGRFAAAAGPASKQTAMPASIERKQFFMGQLIPSAIQYLSRLPMNCSLVLTRNVESFHAMRMVG
jgi:hypothetical protein